MKTFMVAMQFASLIGKLMSSSEGKEIMDSILDTIEDSSNPGGRTQSICGTIRMMLNVPDDD